jgi:hypothetical protein
MGAKAWLLILGIGMATVVVMGMMTKFVVDSSPDLQDVIRFKTAFADTFGARGMEEVSVRRLGEKNGYELLVTGTFPASDGEGETLDREVAEHFLKSFGARRKPQHLKISYLRRAGFGCGKEEPYREKEVSLVRLRAEVEERERRAALGEDLRRLPGCRLLGVEREKSVLAVEVEVAGPEGEDAGGGDSGGALDLAGRLQALVKKHFKYETLRLRLVGPASPEAAAAGSRFLLEVRFDFHGRRLGEKG